MTVSSVIGPVMVQMDRLVIGGVLSMTAVTFYTTPYEVVTKLWMIPARWSAFFSRLSRRPLTGRARAAALFGRGVNYVLFAIFPLSLLLVAFAHEGLDIWLGRSSPTRALRFCSGSPPRFCQLSCVRAFEPGSGRGGRIWRPRPT